MELSSKVLDSFAKLERTLCHELCHVAAWLVDHTAKPPHGPVFKAWADKAMRLYRHLDITTCHAYEIFYPYRRAAWERACAGRRCGGPALRGARLLRCCCAPWICPQPRPCAPGPCNPRRWQCSNAACLQVYQRHSNSIDIAKKVCGACRAPLAFLGKFKPDGTPAKARAPSAFAQFVKDNVAEIKRQLPAGTPHKEAMRRVADLYKAAAQGGGGGGPGSESSATQQLVDLTL